MNLHRSFLRDTIVNGLTPLNNRHKLGLREIDLKEERDVVKYVCDFFSSRFQFQQFLLIYTIKSINTQ